MLELKSLTLYQFRNYLQHSLSFKERVVGICGLNGTGKTNLLDAIYYLSFTRSYFGRTDSQPYAVDTDGNGSLEVVTDGIRVRRQENKIPGKTSLFSLSLQDVFEGISPIHNIGMGVEPDTNRTGYNRLRVEPWDFFYNNDII